MRPSLSVMSFEDSDAQENGISGWEQRYIRTSPGEYNGSLAILTIPGIRIIKERIEVGLFQWSAAPKEKMLFGFSSEAEESYFNGHKDCGSVILQKGVVEISAFHEGLGAGLMLEIDQSLLEEDLGDLGNKEITTFPAADGAREIKKIYRAGAFCQRPASGCVSYGYYPLFSSILIEKIKFMLGGLDRHSPMRSGDLLDKFRDIDRYIVAHLSDQISSQDIKEYFHLSDAQLRSLFHQIPRCSLREWIMYRRLDYVHRMKQKVGAGKLTSLSLDAGYSNFGRMAGYYRRIYGSLPSQ